MGGDIMRIKKAVRNIKRPKGISRQLILFLGYPLPNDEVDFHHSSDIVKQILKSLLRVS